MHFDDFLKNACPPLDLEWRRYRRHAARHRIEMRLKELGLDDYGAYLERLRADPVEAEGLSDLMRVTVSRFFREREHWELLRQKVLPALLSETPADRPLKVWSMGCCGGEEPYTLALIWLCELQSQHPGRAMSILATDIDKSSLERAARASYTRGSVGEIPKPLLLKGFRQEKGLFHLAPEVRRLVMFCRHNLMDDPPPEDMDLILARYLPFTYYVGKRRHAAAERLWRALRPGGALMIGRKEGLSPLERELFAPWPETAGVFYRREAESA